MVTVWAPENDGYVAKTLLHELLAVAWLPQSPEDDELLYIVKPLTLCRSLNFKYDDIEELFSTRPRHATWNW